MISEPRRNRLILTSSLGAILTTYFLFAWLPHRRDVVTVRSQINETLRQVSGHMKQAQELAMLRNELAQLELYLRQIQQSIPEHIDPSGFLARVDELGQEHHVELTSMQPQPEKRLFQLEQQPIRLRLRGRFPAIVRVIYELEKESRVEEQKPKEVDRRMIELTSLDIDSAAAPPGEVVAELDVLLFARPNNRVAGRTD